MTTRPSTPPFGKLVTLPSGHEMHYLEEGSGPPVVWIHGSGPGVSGYSNFSGNYREIAAAGFRSIMPDMIGFGWSSKPTGIDYTLELFSSTLREFLDSIAVRRCVLAGNSLGGAIAIRLALDDPGRVSGLIVMGPGGIESRETYFRMPGIQSMVSQFTGAGFDRDGLRRLLHMLTADPKFVTDDLVEQRFNVLQTQPKEVLARMKIADQTPELGRLACPVLGFWGIDDQFCPPSGYEKFLRSVPDSRFVMYAHCGHWAMIERAADFNRNVIDFLRR
ncbi:MAG: alpha/beta fold hydrolase [Proteobacteria bacterium]|nr:alpha/beta fold hydrolase [Pseudomonadota bacterium]